MLNNNKVKDFPALSERGQRDIFCKKALGFIEEVEDLLPHVGYKPLKKVLSVLVLSKKELVNAKDPIEQEDIYLRSLLAFIEAGYIFAKNLRDKMNATHIAYGQTENWYRKRMGAKYKDFKVRVWLHRSNGYINDKVLPAKWGETLKANHIVYGTATFTIDLYKMVREAKSIFSLSSKAEIEPKKSKPSLKNTPDEDLILG